MTNRSSPRVAGALVLMVAAICLPLGLVLPLVRFERLFVFEDTPSLIEIVAGLFVGGEWLLAAVVALVSIVFPAAKLAVAQVVVAGGGEAPRWLAALSKWSMADVLLVALAILAAKSSGLAAAVTQPGVWFYGASALLAYVGTALGTRGRAGNEKGPPDRSDGP